MSEPTNLPEWDTTETDTTDPGASRKLSGWVVTDGVPEKPSFRIFNHWMNNVYKWIYYLFYLAKPVSSIAELRAISFTPSDGDTINVTGYYSAGDGGGGQFYWDATSTEADNGGTIIKVASVATGRFKSSTPYEINILKFGAPAADDGVTSDTPYIQAAYDYAKSISAYLAGGATVLWPPGKTYTLMGQYGGYTPNNWEGTTASLFFGQHNNIHTIAYGATILHHDFGAAGGVAAWKQSFNCSWRGGKIIGFTKRNGIDDTGAVAGDQGIFGLQVAYGSLDIIIDGVYITNFLGECIQVYGHNPGASTIGQGGRNVKIANCTLKERVGNGIRSSDPSNTGTKSRNAIAIVEGVDVQISNNTIYGRIDIEPNASGQEMRNISVVNNTFSVGPVLAQGPTGTDYNWDEAVGYSYLGGRTEIEGQVNVLGVTDAPLFSLVTIANNIMANGIISFGAFNTYQARIQNNIFSTGQIRVGSDAGTNQNQTYLVTGNSTDAPYSGETCFIRFDGLIIQSIIANNLCRINAGYCIGYNGGTTGDGGQNLIANNINTRSTASGSVDSDIILPTALQASFYSANYAPNETSLSDLTLDTDTANQTIDFTDFSTPSGGKSHTLRIATNTVLGNIVKLSGLTSVPKGHIVTIIPLTGGTESVDIIYSASFSTYNQLNFSMTRVGGYDSITFLSIGSDVMIEVSRSEN